MADSHESAINYYPTTDYEGFAVNRESPTTHSMPPEQNRHSLDPPGRTDRQTPNPSYMHAAPSQGNRRWPLTPPVNPPDSRRASTSFNTAPNSNHSIPSVLPPDVEASLTCLLAAAKSFSTVMTNYDINELTRVREAVADLTVGDKMAGNHQKMPREDLVTTRDLSLSNLYPSNVRGSVTQAAQGHFNLLRSGSKALASRQERNELERLQHEIALSMKKCEDTFKTLVSSTAASCAVESRHFPEISLSVTRTSSSEPPEHHDSARRANDISALAEPVPAIILGRKDLTLARKLMAVRQDAASEELQLLIYTLKTRTKMEHIQLRDLTVRRRSLEDTDLLDSYGVLPFDLNVMKDPDMTGIIEFRGAGTLFSILMAGKYVDTWFGALSDVLNG